MVVRTSKAGTPELGGGGKWAASGRQVGGCPPPQAFGRGGRRCPLGFQQAFFLFSLAHTLSDWDAMTHVIGISKEIE